MSSRDRTLLSVLAVLAVVVGSWLLVVEPRRSQASKLGSQVAAEQAQLNTARSELSQGAAAKSAFAANYASVARLGEAVPANDNVPSLIYELQSAASGSRVDFQSLALAGGGGSSPSSATPAAGAAAASTETLPPGVAIGPAGFPSENFTFTFNGSYFHLTSFLNRINRFVVSTKQQVAVSGRLLTINSIGLAAAPSGFPKITATLSATTYLVPSSQGLTAGATPSGPAATTAQPVSTSGSSTPAPSAAITAP
jgi:hypothetical protein